MSESEAGVWNNGGNVVMQKASVFPPQPVIQSLHLAFGDDGSAVYKPVAGNGNAEGMGMGMAMAKKKRGRPRKYGSEGAMSQSPSGSFPLSSPPLLHHHHQQQQLSPQPQQQPPPPQPKPSEPQAAVVAAGSPTSMMKKSRGRPPGSGKRSQLEAIDPPGIGFTPHVITVNAGEDVASRIMSFSQTGPRAICILSANGAISNVTLHQAATSGGSVTYEGRFEILSLSGSFMLSDSGGPRSRTGGLSVSLAGPDGRVLGGGVAGLLTAASPVQVVVGSFIAESRRDLKIGNLTEPFLAPAKPHAAPEPTGPSSPSSRGTMSESSGGPGSPLNQSTGAVNSTPLGMSSLPWK